LELYIDNFPDDVKIGWKREIYIRNYAIQHIQDLMKNQKYVLIVADADELPRKEYVNIFPELYDEIGSGMRLVMESNIYSFDKVLRKISIKMNQQHPWFFPYIITDYGIEKRKSSLHEMRIKQYHMASMTHIWFAGWHCSYCLNPEDIVRKIESFSHQEMNYKIHKNISWVNKCINESLYLFRSHPKKFMVSNYICDSHGLPDCPNCNYEDTSYSILKTNVKCSNDTISSKYIHFEYRSNTTNDGKELFPKNKKQFYELKDIKEVGFNLAKGQNKQKPFKMKFSSASTSATVKTRGLGLNRRVKIK
jgi:hypothetical protein